MSQLVYTARDNGDLKLLADVDGAETAELAVDAMLDDQPRIKERDFIVIDTEEAVVRNVEVLSDAPVNPKRKMKVTGPESNGASPEVDEDDDEDEDEAPKRRGRPPGSGRKKPGPKPGANVNKDGTPRKKPGPKPGSRRGSKPGPKAGAKVNKDGTPRKKPGPKPGSKRKGRTPFNKRSGSDD